MIEPEVQTLLQEERRELLQLARRSITSALRGEEPPTLPYPSAALQQPAGAFVSLHAGHQLRGCVGTLNHDNPLHQTVVNMARAAAFDDPRFTPVSAVELEYVHIEISCLSRLFHAEADEILTGIHGVCIEWRDHRAVFLPKVATEHGWDRDKLLAALCRKADLAADAWRWPDTELFVLTADVFAEQAYRN